MTVATINRFIQLFDGALRSMGAEVAMSEIESLAMVVHRSMNAPGRAYHDSRHVLGLMTDTDPHQTLAGLFHDVVYLQLDGGLAPHVEVLIGDVIEQHGAEVRLRRMEGDDPATSLCNAVFGFQAQQVLAPFGGMNEYLSAVLALRMLRPYIGPPDLIGIAACIEATIPFRGPDPQGMSAADRLVGRVAAVLEAQPDVGEPAQTSRTLVRRAVGLANRDVGGFAEEQPRVFLSSTWQLIEESNAPLNAVGVYTLQEYRSALMRMDGFLSQLDPADVYQRFDGYPEPDAYAALQAAATRNVRFSVDYLRAKIATLAVVEAIAICTGGNCPISMLLGDIHGVQGRPDRVEDFLPHEAAVASARADLLDVLERGRSEVSANDLTQSPLTAFAYRRLGHPGMEKLMERARRLYSGSLSAPEFLRACDNGVVLPIIAACERIAVSRRDALGRLARELQTARA